ncbi:hypothetical protein CROQUDRAFT_93366 [Cronartium quercuum f. sp. fusiforme G11]|uniref:Uncharacterized protein n=1 Tax=Cronartium quercuum f. sp. fusiforme G11 TaxID=708437 RepID=A0A9P6TBP6_9BASI|nr:hypothetical protein CROQUDRAFT_93366 [Cronartium quercuum f. sp. fusiforme G11]
MPKGGGNLQEGLTGQLHAETSYKSEHTELRKSQSTTVRDQLGLHCLRTPRTALSE